MTKLSAPGSLMIAVHLAFLAIIVLPFLLWGNAIDTWFEAKLREDYPAAVVVLVTAALTADVFLPIPSSFVSTMAAIVLGPAAGFFTILLGMTLGALIAWALGYQCRRIFFERFYNDEEFRNLSLRISRYGVLTLVLCRAVPVLAELSVIAAGFHKVRFLPFFAATFGANVIIAATWAGLASLAGTADTIWAYLVLMVVVPALAWLLHAGWISRLPSIRG